MKDQVEKERGEIPDPAPVIVGGVRYAAVLWGRARGLEQNGGIIAAQDPTSGMELWTLVVYRTEYDTAREGDKQDVFIESITAQSDETLRVVTERGDRYLVDVVHRTVVGPS